MPRKLLPIAAVVAAAAGFATACAPTEPATAPPARSDKTSPCGPVGLPAVTLGLERTRALTACLLNEERARESLPPLRYEVRLELASQRHSDDMVGRRFFEHDTPDGVDPQSRMLAAGYPAHNAMTGENIAWGMGPESSPAEIMDSWMHSPGHRENIVRPAFTEVGVGVSLAPPEPGRAKAATYTTDFGGPPLR